GVGAVAARLVLGALTGAVFSARAAWRAGLATRAGRAGVLPSAEASADETVALESGASSVKNGASATHESSASRTLMRGERRCGMAVRIRVSQDLVSAVS